MANYCQVADVKPILHIDSAENSEDTELASCIVTGSGLVDGFLKVRGLAVPNAVPQLIKDATSNFAAWAYRRVRDSAAAQQFWNDAMQFLQSYIDSEAAPYLGAV